jgi:hypothetical protein
VWWGDACSKLPEVAAKYGKTLAFKTPLHTLTNTPPLLLLLLLLQVDVWWGDACSKLPEVAAKYGKPIDFLLLDGTPKETLAYLQAAEPHLAQGAIIVADNAGEELRD